jgi:hypothetical protein
MLMAVKKPNSRAEQNLRPTTPCPPIDPGRLRSDVRDLGVGKRSLRDAVLLLAMKLQEELGVDMSEVTEMLGVCTPSSEPPGESDERDADDRDTLDLSPPVRRVGRDRSDE